MRTSAREATVSDFSGALNASGYPALAPFHPTLGGVNAGGVGVGGVIGGAGGLVGLVGGRVAHATALDPSIAECWTYMHHTPSSFVFVVLTNCLLIFLLNMLIFVASIALSPLTVTVTGNLKSVATVLFGVLLFHGPLAAWSATGMAVNLAGGVWYSLVKLRTNYRS